MAATVHGSSPFGALKDLTATGLLVGSNTSTYAVEMATAKNHLGCDASIAFFNDSTEVTCSGVIAVTADGLVPDLAAAITLANSPTNASPTGTHTGNKNLFTAMTGSAGFLVTGASFTRSNSEFSTGEISAVLKPLIATNTPNTILDAT
jgi:hypothetical protein